MPKPPSEPRARKTPPCRNAVVEDKMLDKTIADSFPASDPPSSLPDPCEEDSFAA